VSAGWITNHSRIIGSKTKKPNVSLFCELYTKCTKLLYVSSFLSFFCLSPQLPQYYLMEITSFSQSYNHGKNKNMFSRRPQQCINTLFACFITSLEVCTYVYLNKVYHLSKEHKPKKRRGRSDERTSKKSQPPTKLLNLSRYKSSMNLEDFYRNCLLKFHAFIRELCNA